MLTNWYPPNTKPVRVGWYLVSVGGNEATGGALAFWDSAKWEGRYFQGLCWRGMVNEEVDRDSILRFIGVAIADNPKLVLTDAFIRFANRNAAWLLL